jgi:hypothetical protein
LLLNVTSTATKLLHSVRRDFDQQNAENCTPSTTLTLIASISASVNIIAGVLQNLGGKSCKSSAASFCDGDDFEELPSAACKGETTFDGSK